MPALSIGTTMYRSATCLSEFHRRASEAAPLSSLDVEFIYVNDGSPDTSVLALQSQDPRISIVDASRNFGYHTAMLAGPAQAPGRVPGVTSGVPTAGGYGTRYFGNKTLSDRLDDLEIPNGVTNCIETLQAGRSVVAHFAKAENLNQVTQIFRSSGLAKVETF